MTRGSSKASAPNDTRPYCDDCEEYGHDLSNCPLANEVFVSSHMCLQQTTVR